ncbi:hypothetical protein CLOLEP_00635 [[Clostridium] leptum DSM 753]|uniref:Uncharacterized protein n=1 Tax=[Clostridium] leptum DSM 753 TaxID=428125 RepID=A7VQ08_9FIRM|nr:hypothetical protein CLOLEP_00635 [[Clostridium] leptum DSM 753]
MMKIIFFDQKNQLLQNKYINIVHLNCCFLCTPQKIHL